MSGQTHRHAATRRGLDRLFGGRLSPRKARDVYRELDLCPGCSAAFERWHQLERALSQVSPEPDAVSPMALERVEALVLDQVASDDRGQSLVRATGRLARPWVWGPAAAALGLLLLWLVPRGPARDQVAIAPRAILAPVAFQARGGPARAGDAAAAQVGVRVFQVSERADAVTEVAGVRADGVMTFSYSNASQALGYLTLLGLQGDGRVLSYAPGYGGARSVPILRGVVDEPLGFGVRLAVHHEPGPLRVVAVFSRRALDAAAVAEAVARGEIDTWGDAGEILVHELQLQILPPTGARP